MDEYEGQLRDNVALLSESTGGRREIPSLAVAFVLLGIIFLGVKSEWDDQHDAAASSQLVKQDGQEKAYTAAPFEPYVESPGCTGPLALPTGPVNR